MSPGPIYRFPLDLSQTSDGSAMVGLYDATGMLRFVGSSIEACMEYANLFELALLPSSLQALPEPVVASIKVRGDRHLEERSN
ncbi:MAG: hypothetical protein DBW83_04685 [Synechococcus sp. MED-G69]|nr:MAG: hypothetical protein DBW83_04685 [Synechococcus sp. MED-G69]